MPSSTRPADAGPGREGSVSGGGRKGKLKRECAPEEGKREREERESPGAGAKTDIV